MVCRIIPCVFRTINGIFSFVRNSVVSSIFCALDSVRSRIVSSIFRALDSVRSRIVSSIFRALDSVRSRIVSSIFSAFGFIRNRIILDVFGFVLCFFGGIFHAVHSIFSLGRLSVFSGVFTAVHSIFHVIRSRIFGIVDRILGFLGYSFIRFVGSGILGCAFGIIRGILRFVGCILRSSCTLIFRTLGRVLGAANGIISFSLGVFGGTISCFFGTLCSVIDFAFRAVDRIASFILGVASFILGIGGSIIISLGHFGIIPCLFGGLLSASYGVLVIIHRLRGSIIQVAFGSGAFLFATGLVAGLTDFAGGGVGLFVICLFSGIVVFQIDFILGIVGHVCYFPFGIFRRFGGFRRFRGSGCPAIFGSWW